MMEQTVENSRKEVRFIDLGLTDYKQAWDYQEKLHAELVGIKLRNREVQSSSETVQSSTPLDKHPTGSKFKVESLNTESERTIIPQHHYLLFCEHPHVYTLGKTGKADHLLINEDGLKENRAEYFHINRGGDITYHGPGQIVGYPILDLDEFFTDIHKYLRYLEEAIILTLKEYGVKGTRIEGLTGVWVEGEVQSSKFKVQSEDAVRISNFKPQTSNSLQRKICAMGVRCSRWVTMHGFAFNVNTDLKYFNNIVPCGINDKAVTSLEKETGRKQDMTEVKNILKKNLAEVFGMKMV